MISPLEKRLRIRVLCALTGAWGVATGYALFILITNRAEETRASTAALHFAAVLAVAVFVVWLTEWFRETIKGEASVGRRSLSAILSSVLLLAVFEVCVLAYEEVSQATFESPYAVKELAARISGKEVPYPFLRPADIIDPRKFVNLLRAGYQQHRTAPSPQGWVARQLGPEMQWTLFPEVAPRPPWHDAQASSLRGDRYYGAPKPENTAKPSAAAKAETATPEGDISGAGKKNTLLAENPAAASRPASPWESFDYETLQHKLDLLEGLDRVELGEGSQIYVPDPAKNEVLYRDFQPLMQRPELAEFAELPASKFSDQQLRQLLAIELNRMLLWEQLYNDYDFRLVKAPEGAKELLNREREDATSYNALSPRLRELQAEPETVERDEQIAEVQDELERTESRLLPAPRVVQLNRALLAAAFPEFLKPAAERFDEHGANLVILGLLWMWAGGALGWILAGAIFDRHGPRDHPARSGALRGLAAALGAAPLFVMGYVLIVRLAALLRDAVHFHRELHYLWATHTYPPDDLFNSTLVPALLRLDTLWHHKGWTLGFVAGLVLTLAALWQFLGWWHGMPQSQRWLRFSGCVAALALLTLLADANLAFVYLLVALVWITPAVFIGICGPYLRTGSPMPQRWGLFAVAVGLGLVLATIVRLRWDTVAPGLLILGTVLIATGMLIRAGLRLEEYWPLGALALGLLVCGVSAVVQQATFVGVLSDVHELNAHGGFGVKLAPEIPKLHFPALQRANKRSSDSDEQLPEGSNAKPAQVGANPGTNDVDVKDVDAFQTHDPSSANEAGGKAAAEWKEAHHDAYDDYFGAHDDKPPPTPTREDLLHQGMQDRLDVLRQEARGMASTGDAALDDEVRTVQRDDEERLRGVRDSVARRLELSIVGSLGFWLAVGLLAGWALQRGPTEEEESAQATAAGLHSHDSTLTAGGGEFSASSPAQKDAPPRPSATEKC